MDVYLRSPRDAWQYGIVDHQQCSVREKTYVHRERPGGVLTSIPYVRAICIRRVVNVYVRHNNKGAFRAVDGHGGAAVTNILKR